MKWTNKWKYEKGKDIKTGRKNTWTKGMKVDMKNDVRWSNHSCEGEHFWEGLVISKNFERQPVSFGKNLRILANFWLILAQNSRICVHSFFFNHQKFYFSCRFSLFSHCRHLLAPRNLPSQLSVTQLWRRDDIYTFTALTYPLMLMSGPKYTDPEPNLQASNYFETYHVNDRTISKSQVQSLPRQKFLKFRMNEK